MNSLNQNRFSCFCSSANKKNDGLVSLKEFALYRQRDLPNLLSKLHSLWGQTHDSTQCTENLLNEPVQCSLMMKSTLCLIYAYKSGNIVVILAPGLPFIVLIL
jgi:hypothetical protein